MTFAAATPIPARAAATAVLAPPVPARSRPGAEGRQDGRLSDLKAVVRRLERASLGGRWGAVATGLAPLDRALPGGGLERGRLHECAGPAALGFVLMLLTRVEGPVLWLRDDDRAAGLYGPGLIQHGLDPTRLTLGIAREPADALWAAEEALRAGPLSAVVLDIAQAVPLTPARRLQLAAEAGGALALVLARKDGAGLHPATLDTRWRVTPMPGPTASGSRKSDPAAPSRQGRRILLERCRGGRPLTCEMEERWDGFALARAAHAVDLAAAPAH